MKAQKLGILSALVASFCCVTPLVLVVLGLGSLGLSAALGRFHWWFLGAALFMLSVAWRRYFRERKRCATEQCEMASGPTTRWTLLLASLVVAAFSGLNVYIHASQRLAPHRHASSSPGQRHLMEAVIPVEGMTCLTCELTLESSLERLPGVQSADARVAEQAAYVHYDPAQISLKDIREAINKTGYRARSPN